MWLANYAFFMKCNVCIKTSKSFLRFFSYFFPRHNGLSMLTEFGNHDIGERYVTRHEPRAHII